MADTFNVSSTEKTEYTWGNVPFTWGTCQKAWGDAAKHTYSALCSSYTSITDIAVKKYTAEAEERFTLADGARKSAKVSRKEALKFQETYWDVIQYRLHLLESCKVRDTEKQGLMCLYNELASVAEYTKNATQRRFAGSIGIGESWQRKAKAYRKFESNFSVDESWRRFAGKVAKEKVSIADKKISKAGIKKSTSIQFTDSFSRRAAMSKAVSENVAFSDMGKKSSRVNLFDVAGIRDSYIKACESVLSNLYIGRTAMTDENFSKLVDMPSGYKNFIDFKVGEYEYKDALIRIVLQSKVPQLQPTAADIVMHVDIPDTDDRGTAQITDTTATTKVYFNKHYYNAPEVNVVVRGGSTSDGAIVPYLVTTDGEDDAGRYFEVELINSSNERTTGTISWVSKGY